METISTAIVPFGLVAAKRAYGKKGHKSTKKMGMKLKKTLRRLKLARK